MIDQDAHDDSIINLVIRAVEGDSGAFGEIYIAYLDAIYRYIFFRVSDYADAEDLTEEVFVRAWEALPDYQIRQVPFKSWLYRIAHNLVVDHHRKRRPVILPAEVLVQEPTTRPQPEESVVQSQEQQALIRAVARLGHTEQEVILLRFVAGLSHQEVALAIGKSEEASRVIQHRALVRLQRYLDSND